jgi:exodeoxyribonuclease VII small subunit
VTDTETPADLEFEDALHRLEQLVEELERGDPGLSEALAKYEEGVRLLARCQSVLERAERSIALLTGVDETGEPLTAPFDATATANDASAPSSPKAKSRKRSSSSSSEETDSSIPF